MSTQAGMPVISVVMPAYNAAKFLADAVHSVLKQTEADFELILIDDGSTDATGQIAHELCATDARIRFFTQENRGIVATLNRGLDLCRGEFVARMDADDVALPHRFERQLGLLQRYPDVVICGSDALRIGAATGRIRQPRSDRACRAWLLLSPCFVHPTVMFRRTVLDRGVRYRTERQFAEDYQFWCEVARLGRMRNVPEPLLLYRFHAGQLSSTKRIQQQRMHVEIAMDQLARAQVGIQLVDCCDILWPERSQRSRMHILLSACGLFLRMAVRGKFNAYLSLAVAWTILRARRVPESS